MLLFCCKMQQLPGSSGTMDRHQALVAVDRDLIAIFDRLRREPRAHDARHAIFPADDRRMRERAAAITDARRNLGESGRPGRGRSDANQDVALLQPGSSSGDRSTRAVPRATPDDAGDAGKLFGIAGASFIRARNSSVMPKISITTGSAMVSGGVPSTIGISSARLSQWLKYALRSAITGSNDFRRLLAVGESAQFRIEKKIHVVRIVEIDGFRDRLRGLADRQRAAHVDVPIMIVVPPGKIGVLARRQRLIERAALLRRHLGARSLDQLFALG